MICPNYVPGKGYIEELPSLTQPNESLTVREIIDRFAVGREVPSHDGYYDDCVDEELFEDPTREPGFDMADASELASAIADSSELASEAEAEEEHKPADVDQKPYQEEESE